jgi:hypothetical protein
VTAAAGLAMLLAAGAAQATEGGGGHYPNGAEDFMAGALPPPGTYLINYLTYYTADDFEHPLFSDFDVDVVANTLRLIHVTDQKVLGANWAMHVFIPIVYQDVTLPFGSDDTVGIGDLIVSPLVLGWHFRNWHFVAGLDLHMPTGSYDEPDFRRGKDLANIGRNYWTLEPAAAFSYRSDGGFEVSAKFMYDFNTENDDTDYESGQEFHFDYTVGYHTGPWAVGVGGYYYKQTTGDDGDGAILGDFKGQAFAIGPQVQYGYKNMSFTLKYHAEMDVENRPEGDALWLKFLYAF